MTDTDDRGRPGGIAAALSQLSASAIALLRTRLELATVELEETTEYVKEVLVLAVVGAMLALFALLFASMFVIIYFWDTYRLGAFIGVTVFYAILAALVFARLKQRTHGRSAPFAATLSAFKEDAEILRRKP